MIIPSSNSYKILNSLPNNIKILASSNVNTLCALSMFTEILKKQSVQYEIQIVNDRVKIIDKQYTVCIDTHQDINFGMYFGARELLEKKSITVIDCTLTKEKSLLSVMSMYDIARNINFITERIMWPINVCLAQALQINEQRYEEKENDENGTRKNTHKSFAELEQMIAVDTQKINTIRMENKFYIPYLRTSTLFNSLITIKSKHKTYEMLAYLGISINEANQPFESTTSHTKETINDVSSTEVICKVSDVDRITPIENYYNMIYYLSQEKYTDALLSLEKICYKGKRIYECIKTIEHTKMKKVNGLNIIFVKKRINLKNKYLLLNLGYEAVKSKCDALIYTCEESIVVTDKKMNELNVWKGCYKVEKNNVRKCIEYLAYLN